MRCVHDKYRKLIGKTSLLANTILLQHNILTWRKDFWHSCTRGHHASCKVDCVDTDLCPGIIVDRKDCRRSYPSGRFGSIFTIHIIHSIYRKTCDIYLIFCKLLHIHHKRGVSCMVDFLSLCCNKQSCRRTISVCFHDPSTMCRSKKLYSHNSLDINRTTNCAIHTMCIIFYFFKILRNPIFTNNRDLCTCDDRHGISYMITVSMSNTDGKNIFCTHISKSNITLGITSDKWINKDTPLIGYYFYKAMSVPDNVLHTYLG